MAALLARRAKHMRQGRLRPFPTDFTSLEPICHLTTISQSKESIKSSAGKAATQPVSLSGLILSERPGTVL